MIIEMSSFFVLSSLFLHRIFGYFCLCSKLDREFESVFFFNFPFLSTRQFDDFNFIIIDAEDSKRESR